MSDLLQRGITALKSGDKVQARRLLGRAIQTNPRDEQAWLWLSGAVESDQEQLRCLSKVLEINPANEMAKRGVGAIRKKQEQAAEAAKSAPPFPWIADVSSPQSQLSQPIPGLNHSRGLDELPPEQREALEGFTQLTTKELVSHRSRQEIIERLVKRGFPRQAVKQFVDELAPLSIARDKMIRRKRYGKMMWGGLLLTLLGIGGSVITYIIATEPGSVHFYLIYGVIFAGLANLIIGSVGWFTNQ